MFVEGGPTGDDSAFGRAQLGLGFRDLFQKQRQLLADQYVLLDFTFCGGRGTARKRFQSEVKANLPNQICALLVDAEAPFVVREGMNDSESRKFHLSHRTGDEWDMKGIDSTAPPSPLFWQKR